jgi:NAD+ kinase
MMVMTREGVPLFGINRGKLGFLAAYPSDDVGASLRSILAGDFRRENRALLEVRFADRSFALALNDVVIKTCDVFRMGRFTVHADGAKVNDYRADGLILATPTGSTAYNLAAGGPTVSWRTRAYVISFIAAHHLDTRPLILAPEESLVVTNSAVVGVCDVLADGVRIGELPPGRSVTVGLGGEEVHLAIFPESSFFRRYREKFGRP